MKNLIQTSILMLALVFMISGCEQPDILVEDVPKCIKKEIKKLCNKEVQNPPAQVWRWESEGNTWYHISSDCCDQLNYLYDTDCNQVCAPDGGILGEGAGDCPNFPDLEVTMVWEDPR